MLSKFSETKGFALSSAHFTQADSIIPNPGNSGDWDRYAYVLNNPINFSDPSGHYPGEPPEDNVPLIDGDKDLHEAILAYCTRPKMKISSTPWDADIPVMDGLPLNFDGRFYFGFGYNNVYLENNSGLQNGHSGVDYSAPAGSEVWWPFKEPGIYIGPYFGSTGNCYTFQIGDVYIIFNHVVSSDW